jgi:predicted CxxxxCH...CXXCH cytochrome family protein
LGNRSSAAIGVGAHQAHLKSSIGRSLSCAECHTVPDEPEDPGHIEGLPARVQLRGVATTEERSPTWLRNTQTCSASWCHGPTPGSLGTSPRWTDAVTLGCASCHGDPPAPPHPQSSRCSLCHAATVGGDDHGIVALDRHIDGVVDVAPTTSCTACHGALNAAPPRDLDGQAATSSPGVGAHQTHVLGTERSRKVACAECHRMPDSVLAPGHLDSARPAEVVFSGVAVATSAQASYDEGSCRNTACHGGQWNSGNASGGILTEPSWTKVDGAQAACGTCHGLPPPPPHPYAALNPVCSACHEDIAPDNQTFLRPDLHVDGEVTFSVP